MNLLLILIPLAVMSLPIVLKHSDSEEITRHSILDDLPNDIPTISMANRTLAMKKLRELNINIPNSLASISEVISTRAAYDATLWLRLDQPTDFFYLNCPDQLYLTTVTLESCQFVAFYTNAAWNAILWENDGTWCYIRSCETVGTTQSVHITLDGSAQNYQDWVYTGDQ